MVEVFVNDIQNSLKNHSYFSALALALALPDICACAEYPEMEDRVGQRYISWYDKYIGQHLRNEDAFAEEPSLSGELVYNLRNTYLHQGSPNVEASKIKEEENQIDRFILVLGDGKIQMLTMNVSVGPANIRMITIDVTFLCGLICEYSLAYYRNNVEKFHFRFNVVTEEELMGENSPLDELPTDADPLGDLSLTKLYGENHTRNFEGNLTQQILTHIKTSKYSQKNTSNTKLSVKSGEKKLGNSKEEQRFRSFFGKVFPEKKYKEKKEQIVGAVLSSETKMGLNNRLMKIMPGEEVKEVLKRLKPYVKDWPGQ